MARTTPACSSVKRFEPARDVRHDAQLLAAGQELDQVQGIAHQPDARAHVGQHGVALFDFDDGVFEHRAQLGATRVDLGKTPHLLGDGRQLAGFDASSKMARA